MKLLCVVTVLAAALLSHCAVIQSSPSLDLLARNSALKIETDTTLVNGTDLNSLSTPITWTTCFICLTSNYWSLRLIEYQAQLPSYLVLTRAAAAVRAFERCTQLQPLCDLPAWEQWKEHYQPLPMGASPTGW